ncbi:hypothetical protein F5B22DRAFT_633225 [Xylaria bambusicola]|uniref:uncharacterized protein n=1 Tax=Xylaria bambusicola TaxID=326684 RepID=UPI002008A56E|nr:uncharacterized protein F5B22DRAFT_633225 [Xylaria bambusicola]KAI0525829.1 hypothetical protein F5B22DRAFT_633225 [Xylaria bambusicola]
MAYKAAELCRRFYSICEYFDTGLTQGEFSRARLFDISFEDIRLKFFDFGDHLFNNFSLPGRGGQQYIGTGPRPSVLRRDCLIRDRHRCVISRRFDHAEAWERRNTPGDARDDEGNLLENDPDDPEFLEVAHILPHSLTKVNQGGELGPEIDRPRNAITLTTHYHRSFGDFQVYFEPVPEKDHICTIKTFYPRYFVQRAAVPIICELYLTPERTIEPPSRRLLAIHWATLYLLLSKIVQQECIQPRVVSISTRLDLMLRKL